jgi:NADH-quinone oxidoreductase subunit K
MFLNQIFVNIFLFLISVAGLALNRRNVLIAIMCIELMLLSINLNFVFFSLYLDDSFGQIAVLLILTVAAAESSVGLALLIIYYRIHGNILITQRISLRG